MNTLSSAHRVVASTCRNMRHNLTHVRYSSASTSPTPDLSQGAKVRLKHPRTAFREQMTQKRKQYFAESKEALKRQEAIAARQKEQEEARRRELSDKIRQFKAERLKSFSEVGDAEQGEPVSVKEGLSQDGQKESVNEGKDPFFESRRDLYARFKQVRRQKRFENFVQSRCTQSEQRLESLLYLYHSANNFITYENIDARVAELQPTASSSKSLEKEAMTRRAKQRIEALEGTLRGELQKQFGVERLREFKSGKAAGESNLGADDLFIEKRRMFLDKSREITP
ncbi:uncharacterized protein SPPG_04125 [Spizellomyces punctatus DAOM BR117]|uniref:Uncharacterized protein n=1 Tax=Spizellomyces punctatus (strain DAOM BR117) TaxID=645134 RepID=A0A0L0HIU9_SPIPD|nr:uncharacterized protein SPPG_04125 [Spizellomyces punctatus DAOM BR117]KND01032.1 hypothetical protein SPPG_04125 [Spizellomyces punctatus DAOM BR117]|eukprot:XP_016609071.1 hypothetical protein SPPG_04125 [Spizellomyces punctatus DAOM BR117]